MSERALQAGKDGPEDDSALKREMRLNRRVNMRKTAQGGSSAAMGGGSNITFATGRPRDPMFYWRQNNLPFDVSKDEELVRIREFCRLVYLTHPLLASAIDIFSKWPISGMELSCKDKALEEFYETLFFDQLNYEDFLIDVGREYWTVGEAWPLGSFNESLGVWEDDELLNPDDIEVIRSPFLRNPRFEMELPESIREVIEKKEPRWEYDALMRSYPELVRFTGRDKKMPVSNVLLKQLKFNADTFHTRGLPIMMRGIRYIMQEEMLNAAMDAIASRLYTPLILTKLGATAQQLGTDYPWVPERGDIENFEEALDAALAADFRVLIHHFGIEMENVFGKENIPDFSVDFERIQDNQLQVFGMSKTMLMGAQEGETYAADALNRDLITMLLTSYQRKIELFFQNRAYIVAEAQEHFDYEERGGKRYPIMEEVLVIDEETGEERIIEQPKLLVPDIKFRSMNIQDEQRFHQLVESLKAQGIPISMKTRLTHVPVDLEEEIERVAEEQVDLAVKNQEVRKETYQTLRDEGLPIPQDLLFDFQPKTVQSQNAQNENNPNPDGTGQTGTGDKNPTAGGDPTKAGVEGTQQLPMQTLGLTPDQNAALSPNAMELMEAQRASMGLPGGARGGMPGMGGMPRSQPMPGGSPPGGKGAAHRPPESDEQRGRMPKPAALEQSQIDPELLAQADAWWGYSPGMNRNGKARLAVRKDRQVEPKGARNRLMARNAHLVKEARKINEPLADDDEGILLRGPRHTSGYGQSKRKRLGMRHHSHLKSGQVSEDLVYEADPVGGPEEGP